ncbi:MAG: hypothetical protein AAGH88_09110 [Planctomycetota bacterium]
MPTTLDLLLRRIRPERTYDDAHRQADRVLAGFTLPRASIKSFHVFQECIAGFGARLEMCRLGTSDGIPAHRLYAWQRCVELLRDVYRPGGERAAFELARTGQDGGLFRVLQDLAHAWAEAQALNEIRSVVNGFWNGLSPHRRREAAAEYLTKHSDLLPAEWSGAGADGLTHRMPELLAQHPQTLRRLRQAVRSGG